MSTSTVVELADSRHRLRRSAAAVAVAVVFGLGSAIAMQAPAYADHGISTTGDVNLRSGPGTAYDVIGVVPRGVSPTYVCWERAEAIGGVDVWFNVEWEGTRGYITSYYDDSSYAVDDDITSKYGITPCIDPGGTFLTDGRSAPYDRAETVSWALSHATAPQDFPAGCTWFVSRALWAGGLSKDSEWTDEGAHGQLWSQRPGTPAATAVAPFLDHLRDRFPVTREVDLDLGQNAVPEAVPGDLIVYDWEGDGHDDHITMVTSISSGAYPNVAEWGNIDFLVGHPSSGYVERGWTWSENNQRWIQVDHPAATARLVHIDTTLPITY